MKLIKAFKTGELIPEHSRYLFSDPDGVRHTLQPGCATIGPQALHYYETDVASLDIMAAVARLRFVAETARQQMPAGAPFKKELGEAIDAYDNLRTGRIP